MIVEQAVVLRSRGQIVEVELQRESACGHCELGQGCGTGALGRLLAPRRQTLLLEPGRPLDPGERIEIGLPESALVRASLVVYGMPLAGLLVAALLGTAMALGDGSIAMIAVIGFAAGCALGGLLSRRLESLRISPRVLRTLPNPRPIPQSYTEPS